MRLDINSIYKGEKTVITPSLKWHDRVFVTGPLSELQIGPIARNIIGARHSGRRITAALNKKREP